MFRNSKLLCGACLFGALVAAWCAPLSAQGRYDQWNAAPGVYVAPQWGGSSPYWATGSYTGQYLTNYGPYDPFSRFHAPGIYGEGLRVIENPNSRFRPAPRFRNW